MLSEADKIFILECARKHGVSCILMLPSSAQGDEEAEGIVLGVKGIKPPAFFEFQAQLAESLSGPVDVVDLSSRSSFSEVIEKNGVKIYG